MIHTVKGFGAVNKAQSNQLILKEISSEYSWERLKVRGEGDDRGWHHRLNGHEFESTLGVGDGQGSLVCCSPWGHKELDMTEQLN